MPGRYIVIFKDKATNEDVEQYKVKIKAQGGKLHAEYDALFKGFAAEVPDGFVSILETDDLIDIVEPDGVVTTQH